MKVIPWKNLPMKFGKMKFAWVRGSFVVKEIGLIILLVS